MTPEFEAEMRRAINPAYVNVRGTESWERNIFLTEIDRLRKQVSDLRELVRKYEED